MAGIKLSEREMAGLADLFKELRPTFRVHFRTFCDVVDSVFTIKNLEKSPTMDVSREPVELLDKVVIIYVVMKMLEPFVRERSRQVSPPPVSSPLSSRLISTGWRSALCLSF